MARYGAVIGLKLIMSAATNPPMMPIHIGGNTTDASPVARYCDQGQKAPASSTTSSRNDLLTAPCTVMRSPDPTRGWLAKVLSFRPGLPERRKRSAIEVSTAKFERGLYQTIGQYLTLHDPSSIPVTATH